MGTDISDGIELIADMPEGDFPVTQNDLLAATVRYFPDVGHVHEAMWSHAFKQEIIFSCSQLNRSIHIKPFFSLPDARSSD